MATKSHSESFFNPIDINGLHPDVLRLMGFSPSDNINQPRYTATQIHEDDIVDAVIVEDNTAALSKDEELTRILENQQKMLEEINRRLDNSQNTTPSTPLEIEQNRDQRNNNFANETYRLSFIRNYVMPFILTSTIIFGGGTVFYSVISPSDASPTETAEDFVNKWLEWLNINEGYSADINKE